MPACNVTPYSYTLFANHATAVIGLPSTALVFPESTTPVVDAEECDLGIAEIHVAHQYAGFAQNQTPRRGVVGDGVAQGQRPVRDPAVDDLE